MLSKLLLFQVLVARTSSNATAESASEVRGSVMVRKTVKMEATKLIVQVNYISLVQN